MKHLLIGILLGMLLASAVSRGESDNTFVLEERFPLWTYPAPPTPQPLPPMPQVYGAPRTYILPDLKPC